MRAYMLYITNFSGSLFLKLAEAGDQTQDLFVLLLYFLPLYRWARVNTLVLGYFATAIIDDSKTIIITLALGVNV